MVCLVKTEARQRCTPGEKERVWVSPAVRRNPVKTWLVIYMKQFFWVFVFHQVKYLVSFCTPDLP